jgi:exoribonuclease R
VDFAEALLLAHRVGDTFDAVVVDADDHSSVVQLTEPAVRTRMATVAPMGGHVRVRLERADPGARTVTFVPA